MPEVKAKTNLGIKPFRISMWGKEKCGKSHLAAMFVSEFDGVIIDVGKANQISSMCKGGAAPTYTVANVGDAAIAAENVGIPEEQYRFVRNFQELIDAIDYAKFYRENVSKKPNKRNTLVIDDTTNWRWIVALYCMEKNKHASLSQPDWQSCTMTLGGMIQDLEANFNCIFINQSKEGYDKEKGEYTGERTASFFPPNIGHICDYSLKYEIRINEEGMKYPAIVVESIKNMWVCAKDVVRDIVFENPADMTPQAILTALKIDESLW